MLCILSYLLFKKSFIGRLVVNKIALENSVIQNAICYFIFRNFFSFSRSTTNHLTVITDRIARVLKTFGATRAVVLRL